MLGPGLGRRHLRQSISEAGIDLDGVEVGREISHRIESVRLGLGIDDGLLVLVSPTRWTDSNHVPLRLVECRFPGRFPALQMKLQRRFPSTADLDRTFTLCALKQTSKMAYDQTTTASFGPALA